MKPTASRSLAADRAVRVQSAGAAAAAAELTRNERRENMAISKGCLISLNSLLRPNGRVNCPTRGSEFSGGEELYEQCEAEVYKDADHRDCQHQLTQTLVLI